MRNDGIDWNCRYCVFNLCAKEGGADVEGASGTAIALKTMKQKLHYDMSALVWDSSHKNNTQEVYCYCGGSGHWNLKMLQCYKCSQWFHEACLQCLSCPILNGDRFYIFACAICNKGNEYIKRLPLRWVDVVHLVLYNITLVKKIKYFDVNETIVPYFNQHWDELRLGELAYEASTRQQLRDRVKETLQTNSVKFQCGSESKKSKSAFRLRSRSAPEPPHVTIPVSDVIDDAMVESLNLRHGSDLITLAPTPPPATVESSDESKTNGRTSLPTGGKRPYRRKKLFSKSLLYDTSEDSQDSALETPPVKRGRGRPRRDGSLPTPRMPTMSSTPITNGRSTPNNAQQDTKRGRGRSKKNVMLMSSRSSKLGSCGTKNSRSSATIVASLRHPDDIPSDLLNHSKPVPISELSTDITAADNVDLISQIPRPTRSEDGEDDADSYKPIMAKYYSAAGRIAAGEKYVVRAKRVVTSNNDDDNDDHDENRTEYLIEWLGFSAHELDTCQQKH